MFETRIFIQDRKALVGDCKLQADGKVDKAEGKVRNAVGGVKDTIRKA